MRESARSSSSSPRPSMLGTIVLAFVLAATSGALAGATAAFFVTPTLLPAPMVYATTTTPVTPTSTVSEPSLIPLEPRLAEPLLPPNFVSRRASPVAAIYRKARGTTPEERLLTDDRLLGQAVAFTSDGWFATVGSVIGTVPMADLTVWHDGIAYTVTKGIADKVNGTVYLKVDARDLTVPAFSDVERLVIGSGAWMERRASSFLPAIVADLGNGISIDGSGSETAVRRVVFTEAAKAGDTGAPMWDERGSLLGIVESDEDEPLSVVPVSSIAASFSSLLSSGEIRHASLGVRGVDLSAWRIDGDRGEIPRQGFLLREDRKLGRAAVAKDSAASAAGLRAGDVILAVERDTLDGTRDLGEIISEYRPGADVTLRVWRDGAETTVPVTLGNVLTGDALR